MSDPSELEKRAPASWGTKRTWVLGLIIVVLTVNWLCAIGRFQVNIPAWDQWDFYTPLFENQGPWALFTYQHGPHRQGLGFVLSAVVMKLSHWDARWESVWIVSLIIGSAVLALRLKRHVVGPLRIQDAWIPILVMTLAQYQTVITTANSSHSVFPLTLILLTANVWVARFPSRFFLVGWLAGCLAFTGFGIFGAAVFTALLVGTLARAVLQQRWNELGWVAGGTIITAAAWIAFFSDYTFQPAAGGFRFPWSPFSDYGRFLALMLSYPAGVQGASFWGYLVGSLALGSAILVLGWCVWRWLTRRERSAEDDVILALLGAGLLFAANTAVGRVQGGAEAGMTSRYVTLLIPIWLGLGLWAGRHLHRANIVVVALLWLMSLWPYHEVLSRPARSWLGTAGLTRFQVGELEESTEARLQAAEIFLHQPELAARDPAVLAELHPQPATTHLLSKLDWLRANRLSLFASPAQPDYLPWIPHDSASWHGVDLEESAFRWMGTDATLMTRCVHPAYVNFQVLDRNPDLPDDGGLAFVAEGRRGLIPDNEQQVISLPVASGTHVIQFRSTTGARPVHTSSDRRDLSFRLTLPWITAAPAGAHWAVDPSTNEWRTNYSLEIESGGYGWESSGLQWTSERLELKARVAEPGFLNIAVVDRAHDVSDQPIILEYDGRRYAIALRRRQVSFSIPIRATAKIIPIELTDTAGALRPADGSDSSDRRSLALRLSRLSIDAKPAFQLLK